MAPTIWFSKRIFRFSHVNGNSPGRQLEFLRNRMRFNWSQISIMLLVSRTTLWRRIRNLESFSSRHHSTRTGGPSWSGPTFVPASKSISNQGTFCNFSLAPKRKIYKTSMKHLKIHKFPFKNVIVLAIECKVYLKIQPKLSWLGCISKQTMGSAVKKTRLNSSKDDFLMKSFRFSTKRKLSILLNFLFPFFVF